MESSISWMQLPLHVCGTGILKHAKIIPRFVALGKPIDQKVTENQILFDIDDKVKAFDVFIDYPDQLMTLAEPIMDNNEKNLVLSYADSLQGYVQLSAGFRDENPKVINIPYNIKGREDVAITVSYRTFDKK